MKKNGSNLRELIPKNRNNVYHFAYYSNFSPGLSKDRKKYEANFIILRKVKKKKGCDLKGLEYKCSICSKDFPSVA